MKYFKGAELYNYFKTYLDNDLTVTYKVQHVDAIPKKARGTITELFQRKHKEGKRTKKNAKLLQLENLMDITLGNLSGGELQRFQ